MPEPLTSVRPPSVAASARPAYLRTAALVAGDAVSFLIFANTGRASHNETSGLGAIGAVAGVALPFAIGWFAVSPFAGAFRRRATSSLRAMLTRTELAWLCAWPIGLALRALPPSSAGIEMPFPLIVLAFNALFLGLWRGAFALVEARLR
jgi:hypothetical protein